MVDIPTVQEDQLQLKDPPRKVWIRVQDAVRLLWEDNPKRHDVGALIQSVQLYGFQDTPKYDANLPNVSGGQGGIKDGNGRVEVLGIMERSEDPQTKERYELPRGLGVDGDGVWVMPVDVGTDARSREEAEAYAVDANNLVLSGGDFTPFDAARMWGESYVNMLARLAQADVLPLTVGGDALDQLLALEQVPTLEQLQDQYGDPKNSDYWPDIKLKVPPSVLVQYRALMGRAEGDEDHQRFAALLAAAVEEVWDEDGSAKRD